MAAIQRHDQLITVLAATLVLATAAVASPSREILDRRKALDDGPRRWNDRAQHIALTIVASRGATRHRELVVYERRRRDDVRETIIFFAEPAEVRGTGFLSVSKPGKAADQWLYLPALNRIRQIKTDSRKRSFVGTDLSYEDLDLMQEMPSWSEDDAASELIRDETIDGVATHVIGLTPRRADVSYGRIVLWLGVDDLVLRRLEFFEDGDDPVKRIVQKQITLVGKIPVAHRLEIEQPGASHTVMEVGEVSFDQNLEDDLFTQRALERGERVER